jgi:hypothetical protein
VVYGTLNVSDQTFWVLYQLVGFLGFVRFLVTFAGGEPGRPFKRQRADTDALNDRFLHKTPGRKPPRGRSEA